MRLRYALAILAATVGPVWAEETPSARAETTGDIVVDALPEVEVAIPSDRSEFSVPELPAVDSPQMAIETMRSAPEAEQKQDTAAGDQPSTQTATLPTPDIAPPDVPDVVVAIPSDPAPAIASAPPVTAEAPQQAQPQQILPQHILPQDAQPKIAIAPPVVEPKPAPVSQPQVTQDWKPRLDKAMEQIAGLGSLPPAVQQSLRAFYEAREFRPVFTDGAGIGERGKLALAVVDQSRDHGLDPRRFQKLVDATRSADADVRELAVAAASVAYARDARGARINPQSVSRLITATPTIPDARDVLEKLASVPNAGEALESWNPQHEGYQRLKARLAALRGADDHTASVKPRLAYGDVLWVGMSDARVPLLREMLNVPAEDNLTFNAALSEAVKRVQREQGMRANGRLDRRTVAALGGGEEPQPTAGTGAVADVIANMERWRWLPADLGSTYVMVNVPSYWLEMKKRDGSTVFETRVVVGKPNSPTPIFSHQMEYLVVNPSWNVPPSIATKEYLPLLKSNPYALQARGLQIVSRGKVVDPATVDWSKIGRSVAIRQPPGERNALGNIKFMFPNEHAVYLHDTPSRGLFAASSRAFSHGCVRVQNPFALASAVMGWNEGRLRGMVGGGERRIDLPGEVDVHLAYFTVAVKADGTVERFDDIYGHQRRTKALLGL